MFFAALGIRTHAFEPLPANVERLRCSAIANNIDESFFVINDFGLSDKDSDGGCMVYACNCMIVYLYKFQAE